MHLYRRNDASTPANDTRLAQLTGLRAWATAQVTQATVRVGMSPSATTPFEMGRADPRDSISRSG